MSDLFAYLIVDEVIDHHHPLLRETAARLASTVADSYAYARAAYEFIRDVIPHSADSDDPRVTWRASGVLEQGTGICHANGLIAVRFNGAWHRQDCHGNKPGVDAQFSLEGERLAWVPHPESAEMDYSVLYAEPHPAVLHALKAAPGREYLWKTLPTAL
ncbi:transglutaminase [Streptomyces vastus]|uniref:Transglutaminase domain-containing protein n=1 Tax=Streptomyces vastus TaxID=285451 RepID=A0ABP6CRS7_9ACTN